MWRPSARRGLRTLAAAAAVAGAVTQAAPAGAGDGQAREAIEQWRDTRADLDAAGDGLTAVEAEVEQARQRLAEADARLTSAAAELERLGVELAQAEAAVRDAQARAAAAARELAAATRRLERTLAQLDQHSRELGVGAVSAYKYGGDAAVLTGVVDALTGSGNVTEFLATVDRLTVGVERKHELVTETGELLERVERRTAAVRLLREERAAEEAAATQARDRVAALTARQVAVVAGIDADRRQRAETLQTLEADQSRYEALVVQLERESEDLRQQLRAYRFTAGAPGSGELVWPTDGPVTSGFGHRHHPLFGSVRMHEGIDIGAPSGQPILAAADGQVVHAGSRGGYGNAVVIDHGGGLSTLYAHQSEILVGVGEVLAQGDLIGLVGSTGYSTGPHLHFEVRVDGVAHDPMAWY